MKRQRVAVLGLGKIGSILLDGLLKAGLPPENAVATVPHAERAQALAASGQGHAARQGADVRAVAATGSPGTAPS